MPGILGQQLTIIELYFQVGKLDKERLILMQEKIICNVHEA